jgi:hypothetical protein
MESKNYTWEQLDLKLAVQEAQGTYEKLCAEKEEDSTNRLDPAVRYSKQALDKAYRELKAYNEDK